MASLLIDSVSKSFGTTRVLNAVSLEIGSGDLFFILGASGCGKTTLLRIIAGLETPSSGRILLNGRDITDTPPHQRGIGLVFQQYALWPHMTVAQNISFGLEVQRTLKAERAARVREALALVRMERFAERYPHEISGGQQQRVALARALAIRPSVLLLDEPLSNLDVKLREEIRSELRSLHSSLGITMIYVTHDQEDAMELASRIALIREGEVEQIGSPREIYEDPRTRYAAEFLGRANIVPVDVMSRDTQPSAHSGSLICVRPESVHVEIGQPPANRPSLEAHVSSVHYKGASLEVECRGPHNLEVSARLFGQRTPGELSPGTTVYLHWDASAARILER